MIDAIIQAVTTAILSILGVGGLIYWMKRHIDALKGAVDAQHKTIEAQAEILKDFETLNKIMKTVIDTVNESSMLRRVEDYKKFVDHEKERALQESETRMIENSYNFFTTLMDFIKQTMSFVPPGQRKEVIDSITLPFPDSKIQNEFKERLYRIAERAPYQPLSEEDIAAISKATQNLLLLNIQK